MTPEPNENAFVMRTGAPRTDGSSANASSTAGAFAYPVYGMPLLGGWAVRWSGMFRNCLHAEESHHDDGCHALYREGEGLMRCWCRRSRERVAEGPDHLNDALRLATARARRRSDA